MKKGFELEADESCCWEARPAPRCYTFRHWKHSIFGAVFLLICAVWQVLGVNMAAEYDAVWVAWLPTPFLLLGLYFSLGHLVQARVEWRNVCYMITDRRLIAQRGIFKQRVETIDLSEVSYFKLTLMSEQLGTISVHKELEKQLILHCIEHPRKATDLLEAAIRGAETEGASSSS